MKKVYKKLQLDSILQSVAKHAISDVAKQKIINTIPSNNVEEIRHLLCETEEACRNLSVYNINPEFSFDSVQEVVNKARIFSTLSMSECLKVMRILRICLVLTRNICGTCMQNTLIITIKNKRRVT